MIASLEIVVLCAYWG